MNRDLSISFIWSFAIVLGNLVPLASPAQQSQPITTPRVYFSDTSRLGRPFAKDPSVIRFRDHYFMYYSLPPRAIEKARSGEMSGWAIGIAESEDLIHWNKVDELLPSGEAESKGIAAPGARVISNKVHLFYQTYGRGSNDAICHAVSDDGVHFVKDKTNPVFHPVEDTWSIGRAIDAEVLLMPDQGKAYLYFASRDKQMVEQKVGVAAADLKSSFGAGEWKDISIDAPVLAPTLPWEETCIEAPTVVKHGSHYYMFYAGAYNNQPQQIGVAISDDGIHYSRLSDNPFLANGAPGTWNSSESGHPGVLEDGDQTYLFYQGNADHGKTYFISMVHVIWNGDIPEVDPQWEAPSPSR